MTDRVCQGEDCDRPLTEQDNKYCPCCRAKRLDRFRKVVEATIAGVTAVAGVVALGAKALGNRK